jgi:predicted DNA-binding transcriptional regulator AlpA
MTLTEIQPNTRLTLAEWCKVVGVGGDQDRVLTMAEWAKECSISPRTARELIATGQGPRVVELSANRLGIRVCDHREWLAERIRRR